MSQLTSLRPATEADLWAINDIYNHYVRRSVCTYQEEPETMEDRRKWFGQHDERHPVIVAADGEEVLGWGSLSPYHPRSAYRRTVEDSIYVHHQHQRRGLGSRLLEELIAQGRQRQHRAIIAAIDSGQSGSVALHARFKFEEVGRFKQVGFKFGQWLDVIYMELLLA